MDFKLSKEHEMARKMFREFAENELEPLAVEIDEEERFPWESVEKFARYGMMGIPIPKKYGGAGGDNLMYCIAIEEISKKCATSSVIVAYARAAYRMNQEGQKGCKTVFDVAPAYLSALDGAELRKHLL